MPRKPNVIVFFTDQQRADTTGVHGNPLELTPNFDRVAQAGTHIDKCFTAQPVCGPSRSTIQTGEYATHNGCWRNDIPLAPHLQTLGHHFKNGGYNTGYIGKWHLAKNEPVPVEERAGYDYWLAANVLEFVSDAYSTVLYDNDNRPVNLPGYRVDAVADAMIRYIDGQKDAQNERPFYLFGSFIEPHMQNHRDDYPAPDGYAERYAGRWTPPDLQALVGSAPQHLPGYYGMVKRLDEAFGRVLDALKSLNLLDNTIVLFTSDHANHFKTRNGEYKRSCHDSSIRVPAALRGPGFDGGGRLRQLVSLVDLPPTLLDAAGLPVPANMQGRSIVPLLGGHNVDWPGEVFVQISESQVGRAIRTQRWKYAVVAKGKDGWHQGSSDVYTEDLLYDLQADPYELHNLIHYGSHSATRAILRQRLIARMIAAGEKPPTIEEANVEHSGGQRRVSEEEARS